MTQIQVIAWVVGFGLISGFLGQALTRLLRNLLMKMLISWRTEQNIATGDDDPWKFVPRWLSSTTIGILERAFFCLSVAFNLSGTAIAMIAWTAAKGAIHWNRFDPKHTGSAFVAAACSLLSMTLALIGGLVCQKWGLR
jgi:hypothetical protein